MRNTKITKKHFIPNILNSYEIIIPNSLTNSMVKFSLNCFWEDLFDVLKDKHLHFMFNIQYDGREIVGISDILTLKHNDDEHLYYKLVELINDPSDFLFYYKCIATKIIITYEIKN